MIKTKLKLNKESEYSDVHILTKETEDPINPYAYHVWPKSYGVIPPTTIRTLAFQSPTKLKNAEIIAEIERLFNDKTQSPLSKGFSVVKIANQLGLFSWLSKKIKSWFNR